MTKNNNSTKEEKVKKKILILGGFPKYVDLKLIKNIFENELNADVLGNLDDKIFSQVKKTVENISFEGGLPDLIFCGTALMEDGEGYGAENTIIEVLNILEERLKKLPPVFFFTGRRNFLARETLRVKFPNCRIVEMPLYPKEIIGVAAGLLEAKTTPEVDWIERARTSGILSGRRLFS